MSARYTDPRRFGRFVIAAEDIDAWRELGPDPWLEGIDEARVLAVMKKRKRHAANSSSRLTEVVRRCG